MAPASLSSCAMCLVVQPGRSRTYFALARTGTSSPKAIQAAAIRMSSRTMRKNLRIMRMALIVNGAEGIDGRRNRCGYGKEEGRRMSRPFVHEVHVLEGELHAELAQQRTRLIRARRVDEADRLGKRRRGDVQAEVVAIV